MHFYNLTLQPPTAIGTAAIGNFSGTKQQEIFVSRGAGSVLELLRVDATTGKVHSVLTHHVMGVARSLAAFRLTGASKGGQRRTMRRVERRTSKLNLAFHPQTISSWDQIRERSPSWSTTRQRTSWRPRSRRLLARAVCAG